MFDLQPKILELIQQDKKRPLSGKGIYISTPHQSCLVKYRRDYLLKLMKMTKTEGAEQSNDIELRQSLKAYLSGIWDKVKGREVQKCR